MHADQILAQLNEQQREAVTSSGRNVMVVAGAGSGKTRVLVHRIAWLIAVEETPPQNIFAVTFTNKAAKEMSSRVSEILGYESKGMWIGTFHGIAHRFLRLHWSDSGLDQNFQILDADDQLRQIKKIINHLPNQLTINKKRPLHNQLTRLYRIQLNWMDQLIGLVQGAQTNSTVSFARQI